MKLAKLNKFGFVKHECPAVSGLTESSAIIDEPMLFGSHPLFAIEKGGPLTKHMTHLLYRIGSFRQLMDKKENAVIDTRITQCMKGFYPSIGGWHCDEVPRETPDSQPQFERVDPDARHFIIILESSEDHSRTEFVNEAFDFPHEQDNVYKQLDTQVNGYIRLSALTTTRIEAGTFYEFDQLSVHRATPANNRGWRFFFRASVSDRRPVNQIRKQVQVYAPESMGW